MIAAEQSLVCTVSTSTYTFLFGTDHISAEAEWMQSQCSNWQWDKNNNNKMYNNRFVTALSRGNNKAG